MNIIYPDHFTIAVTLCEPAIVRSLTADNSYVRKELYISGTARTHVLDSGGILLEFYDRYAVLFSSLQEFESARNVRFFRRNDEILKDPGLFGWYIEISEEEGLQLVDKYSVRELNKYASARYITIWQLHNGQVIEFFSDDENTAWLFPDLRTFLSHSTAFEDHLLTQLEQEAEEQFFRGETPELLDQHTFEITRDQADLLISLHGLEKVASIAFDTNTNPMCIYRSRTGYYIEMTDFSVLDRLSSFNRVQIIGDEQALQKLYQIRAKYIKYTTGPVHPFVELQPALDRDFPQRTGELIALLPELLNIEPELLNYSQEAWRRILDSIEWNYAFDDFYEQVTFPLIAWLGEGVRYHLGGDWHMKYSPRYGIWEPHLYLADGKEAINFFDVKKALWRHRNGAYYPPYIDYFAIWLTDQSEG